MDRADEPMFPIVDVSHVKRTWLDIPYALVSAAQQLDVYLPDEGDGPFPVVLRIHGGGFEMGDKRDVNLLPFLRAIERGYAMVSVNYRLSGEAAFPAAVQDVKAAVRWIRANGTRYRLDGNRIVAWGDSAGGYLAAMVCVTEGIRSFDDPSLGNAEQLSVVQAAVDWFGPIDFSTMGEQRNANGLPAPAFPPGAVAEPGSLPDRQEHATGPQGSLAEGLESPEEKFLGARLEQVPDLVRRADPTTHVHPGMPPILIQHGRLDPLVPVQQSMDFARAIGERVGAERFELDILDTAGHGGPEFETDENLDRVFAFVDRYLM